uniref:RNA-binding protein 7 n=1 Tax=Pristiophorus japonicus TaxID=55135 RepID=UPI00398E83A7
MGVSNDADKTLFVGNLDGKVTEELLFELFLQAGPLIAVKIPKDKDGKSKQFAFVNFKHEESVHYGKDLLNGIQLYGRAIKIQFRSGSVHESRDGNQSQNSTASLSPYNSNQFNNNRLDRGMDNMGYPIFATPLLVQRSFSSPDSLQRQVMINNMWHQQARGGQQNYSPSLQQPNVNNRSTLQQSNRGMPSNQQTAHQNYSTPVQSQSRSPSPNSQVMWHSEKSSSSAGTQRQQAHSSHQPDNSRFTRDTRFQDQSPDRHYKGNRETELRHDQTSSDNSRFSRDARFQEHSPDRHYRGTRESEFRHDQSSQHNRSWEQSRGGRRRGNWQ